MAITTSLVGDNSNKGIRKPPGAEAGDYTKKRVLAAVGDDLCRCIICEKR
jgi:hypothetical protein